jgi:choline kinase
VTYEACFEFIVLAAGKPIFGDSVAAVGQVVGNTNALRWNIASAGVKVKSVKVVSGFDSDRMRAEFPDLEIVDNPQWRTTLSSGSLFCVDHGKDSKPALVSYSDIVFNDGLALKLRQTQSDIAIAWDKSFPPETNRVLRADIPLLETVELHDNQVVRLGRAANSSRFAGFFPGLAFLSPKARHFITEIPEQKKTEISEFHISELIEFMRESGLSVSVIHAHGHWARVEDPGDLARFILGTKAETLVRLQPLVKQSEIADSIVPSVHDWTSKPRQVLDEILGRWADQDLVVRSSSRAEDSFEESQAGAFESVLGVRGATDLERAINEVIDCKWSCGYPQS